MKSLGLAAFSFVAAAIAFMVVRWRADPGLSYSQNAARTRSSSWYYGGILVIFLALLSLFTYGWMIPALRLPVGFAVVFGIGVVAQTVAAVVPETAGMNVPIHRNASGIMYFSTLGLVALLAISAQGKGLTEGFYYLALVLMAAIMAAAIGSARVRKHAIALQTAHMVIFAAVIMAATYGL